MLVYKSKHWGRGDHRLNETDSVNRVQAIGHACDELAKVAWRLGWIFENERGARTVGRERVEQLGHLAQSADDSAQKIKRFFEEWFGNPAWAELIERSDVAYQTALSAQEDGAASRGAAIMKPQEKKPE